MADSISVSQLQPLAGYVLVEPAKTQKQTASGIYLPDSHDEKPQHGTVIAVGDATNVDGKEVSSPVKKGEQVIYKRWGGNEFKVGDTEFQFIKFEDLLAKIK